MISRIKENQIRKELSWFPVVAIIGPRQIGKTTLARKISQNYEKETIYLDLESLNDLAILENAEIFLAENSEKLIVIDEVQRKPELFPVLRYLIDQDRQPGRFLILGSAGPQLLKQSSESLAGRISYIELKSLNLAEVRFSNCKDLWLRGGFPESYLSDNERSAVWRENFIYTFLERDLPQLGIRVPATTLRRFWTMIAHSHAQVWNASNIAKSMGTSPVTINKYLDILEQTFIVKRLMPHHTNLKKRLVKSPKIYIRDSGILHQLLRIKEHTDLLAHPILGASWEGFIIEQILSDSATSIHHSFYRSFAGAEMDLILSFPSGRRWGVEIKYSSNPKVSAGFWNVIEDLKLDKAFVIYPGKRNYKINKDVEVCDIKYFLKELEQEE